MIDLLFLEIKMIKLTFMSPKLYLFGIIFIFFFSSTDLYAQIETDFQDMSIYYFQPKSTQLEKIKDPETHNARLFNRMLPRLKQKFVTSEIEIIREYSQGVRREWTEPEVELIKRYQNFISKQEISTQSKPIHFASSSFSGPYDFENWTIVRTPLNVGGDITTTGDTELKIIGPNDGIGGTIDFTIEVVEDGNWTFDWFYDSIDIDFFDGGGYLVNETYTELASNGIAPESGSFLTTPIQVNEGDIIGYRVRTDDGLNGPGELTITNFDITPAEQPFFAADKISDNLGLTILGESAVTTLTITNGGGENLIIDEIILPPNFTSSANSTITIEPEDSEIITFTFTPTTTNLSYNEPITISHNATGSPYFFTIQANIIDENVFVYEFDGLELIANEFIKISEGGISGDFSVVIPDIVLDASTNTFSDDLTILITSEPDIESDVLLQVGGFDDFNAEQWIFWLDDSSENPGSIIIQSVSLDPSFFTDGTTVWLGHGFDDDPTPSGTWTGRIAFYNTTETTPQQFTNTRISGEGWYIFSSPKVYTTIDELTTGLWTQCFTGATFNEAPFCNDIPSGQPTRSNVIQYNGQANAWESASSASSLIPPATSIAVYAYNTQDPTGSGAPTNFSEFDIALNGFPFQNQFTVQIPENEFILLGNPYNDVINLGQATGSDFQNVTGVVWRFNKDAVGSFDIYDINDSNGSFEIQPFEGFFVLSNGSNSTFTFDPSWSGAPKQQPIADEPAFIELYLENEYVSASTSFRAVEDAGPHRPGAHYLRPPAQHQITLYSHYEDNAMMIRYLPTDLAEDIYIPVSIESRYEGTVNLRADFTETVPENWDVILTDTFTGNNYNLRSSNNPGIAISPDEEPVQRFQLHISPNREGIAGSDLPTDFALKQNYPNPFNPSTTIEYMLPEPADVRLEVYSVDGRLIHTLQNGNLNAGRHQITFDASNLASGLYIYRLQAGEVQLIRRMTLLK